MLACPECGGVLNELADGDLVRYRCPVGHAYAPESLYLEQRSTLEGALWAALRALDAGRRALGGAAGARGAGLARPAHGREGA